MTRSLIQDIIEREIETAWYNGLSRREGARATIAAIRSYAAQGPRQRAAVARLFEISGSGEMAAGEVTP